MDTPEQAYVDKRLASQRARAERDLEKHEHTDRRVLTIVGTAIAAVVAAIGAIAVALVNNSGEQHKLEGVLACGNEVKTRLGPLEANTERLRQQLEELRKAQDRMRRQLRHCIDRLPQRDPDMVTAPPPRTE